MEKKGNNKNIVMRFWGHLRTVHKHRKLVFRYCRKCGITGQGLTHDLSKYQPTEFWVGVKYFRGDRSPNDMERKVNGTSLAWLHHKGRNKHHLEYWIDYSSEDGLYAGLPMPLRYIAESVCDRIAASRVYLGDQYHDDSPLLYYQYSRSHYLMHKTTDEAFLRYLTLLANSGEEACFAQIASELQNSKNDH